MMTFSDYIARESTIKRFTAEPVFNTPPLSVDTQAVWKTGDINIRLDLIIKYNDMPLAIVEVKTNIDLHTQRLIKVQLKRKLNLIKCKFCIITDGDTYFLYSEQEQTWQEFSFDKIVELIQKYVYNLYTVSHSPLYANKKYSMNIDTSNINTILKENNMGDYVGQLVKNGDMYYFKDESEADFWKELLKGDNNSKVNVIYRYTSLDTAFSILQNASYRMNGIVAMNDNSEIDYFDAYCYNSSNKPHYQILNNLYLSSCCLLNDNLTMWRLYGDEAKGVCLTFEIKENYSKKFLLEMVSYANDKNKDDKLEIIKKLLSSKQLVFNDIDKWKHFFKAKEYSIEQEFRLLFMRDLDGPQRGWLKTKDTSIINPYVDFNIWTDDFPLKLKEVTLGPKCPEKETNKEQLSELIRQNGQKINVTISSIKNYR